MVSPQLLLHKGKDETLSSAQPNVMLVLPPAKLVPTSLHLAAIQRVADQDST